MWDGAGVYRGAVTQCRVKTQADRDFECLHICRLLTVVHSWAWYSAAQAMCDGTLPENASNSCGRSRLLGRQAFPSKILLCKLDLR